MGQHQPPGRIHGRVIDEAGQPVPRASVRVRDDIVIVDLQTTNQRGEFTSRLLFAGEYSVEVEYKGRCGSVDGVAVTLGETTPVTIPLQD